MEQPTPEPVFLRGLSHGPVGSLRASAPDGAWASSGQEAVARSGEKNDKRKLKPDLALMLLWIYLPLASTLCFWLLWAIRGLVGR